MENPILDAPLSTAPKENAGFWLRLAAYLIDSVLVGFVAYLLMFIVVGSSYFAMMQGDTSGLDSEAEASALLVKMVVVVLIIIAGVWLYYALQESGRHQATLGKRAVGIQVTDMNGNRISFGQATGRYFSKIISGIILYIGYIMVAFTEKNQGLHDMIAGTLVVKK